MPALASWQLVSTALDRTNDICHARIKDRFSDQWIRRDRSVLRFAAIQIEGRLPRFSWLNAARMKSQSKTHSPAQDLAPAGSQRYNYSSAIKIFHQKDSGPALLTSSALLPLPAQAAIPGVVCQAARTLLDVSQAWLWKKSGVSRKTINDFENGFVEPKIALNNRLRRALEKAGASFICGEAAIGVVVFSALTGDAEQTSDTRDGEN